jgi:hypothetical protein
VEVFLLSVDTSRWNQEEMCLLSRSLAQFYRVSVGVRVNCPLAQAHPSNESQFDAARAGGVESARLGY